MVNQSLAAQAIARLRLTILPAAMVLASPVWAQSTDIAPSDHQFNQGFTLQGVLILGAILSLGVSILTIMSMFRKWRRESEQDARERTNELKEDFSARTSELKDEVSKHNETVEKRLVTLETSTKDFMPRREIEAKIEHEKANRTTADNALKGRQDRHDDAITDIKVEVGKIGEKHGSLAAAMEEMKSLIKEQGKDHAIRFDKLQDAISQSKGVS